MQITYQLGKEDYIHDCDPHSVIQSMEGAMALKQDPFYGAVYYGPVSSDSPLLSFACFHGAGIYIAVKIGPQIWIFVDSDDYRQTYPMRWGQERVIIPRAYLVPLESAVKVVEHFCETGTTTDGSHWRDYYTLKWDIYPDEDVLRKYWP